MQSGCSGNYEFGQVLAREGIEEITIHEHTKYNFRVIAITVFLFSLNSTRRKITTLSCPLCLAVKFLLEETLLKYFDIVIDAKFSMFLEAKKR